MNIKQSNILDADGSAFDFARAIRQGRGSAMRHILSDGLDDVRSEVLQACLEEQAYDAQCEGQRAAWLYPMLKGSRHYSFFQREIIAALRVPSAEYSSEQMCELLALMTRDGDQVAGAALRNFFWNQDDSADAPMCGSHAIASLDGFPAVLEIARRSGRILQKYPHAWVDSLDTLVEEDALAAALTGLAAHATGDKAITAYLDNERKAIDECSLYQDETSVERFARQEKDDAAWLKEFSISHVLTAAAAHDRGRGKFIRFGRLCTDDDRRVVATRLLTESNIETCLRLLWVFYRAAMPFIPAPLWNFIEHADGNVRWASLNALAQVVDPAIGEFARDYLRRLQFSIDDAPVIELFANNYQAGDAIRLMDFLGTLPPGEQEAHAVGLSILHVCEHHNDAATAPLLEWLYHSNPCTICRRQAIELMIDAKTLSKAIAEESAFDASEATRDMVHSYSDDCENA